MASTFIKINTGQRLGQQLRQGIDAFASARAQLTKLLAVMTVMKDDADFAVVEQEFGLQSKDGARVYSQIGSIVTSLTTDDPDAQIKIKTVIDTMLAEMG